MTQFALVIDTSELDRSAERLYRGGVSTLDKAAKAAVNDVAQRTFDDSVTRMTSRVNLTQARVRQDMDIEFAPERNKAEATIVAFRKGGRRNSMRPTTLRQYNPRQLVDTNNWSNAGISKLSGLRLPIESKFLSNPRKPGGKLPFKPRVGAPALGIPLGRKQDGIQVEVLKGSFKPITYAFMARANNAGMLIFKRTSNDTSGKGKLVPLYGIQVWQLFRKTSAVVLPMVQKDLTKTLLDNIDDQLKDFL